jgi:spore coat polysaccharide biosynthesis protein SpsF
MRRAAIIQARMSSTRLPGKVLRDLGGRPVLEWVVAAARASEAVDDVVVATSTGADDDAVEAAALAAGALVVRGALDDVLARYLLAAEFVHADVVVRLTADCPLLDPALIRLVVQAFDPTVVDYVSTNHPRTLAHGLDVEVTSTAALQRAAKVATGADRVHVTSYLYTHPDEFRIAGVTVHPPCDDLRVTLDEPADATLIEAIVAELGRDASNYRAVVALLRARPDLRSINAAVRQKQPAEG